MKDIDLIKATSGSENAFSGGAVKLAVAEILMEERHKMPTEPTDEEIAAAKAQIIKIAEESNMPPGMAACGFAGRIYQRAEEMMMQHLRAKNMNVETTLEDIMQTLMAGVPKGSKGNA